MVAAITDAARRIAGIRSAYVIALLALCAAYLQGGFVKLFDFAGAQAEMVQFGLSPPWLFAVVVIALELIAPLMILSGRGRWLGALALGVFTLLASGLANRFWEASPAQRPMMMNAFFEHIGLAGGFLMVACYDLRSRARRNLKGDGR